ncbi:restriction endonuclease subunit S [Nitrospira sp. Kam-Ns4a]
MTTKWPMVRLGEVLRRSEETTVLEPHTEYREITVKLWGKGVVERRTVLGSEMAGARRFVARAGQFVLSRIDARNGAIGLVPEELDGTIVSNDFPLFAVDVTKLLPPFLGWMSRTPEFVDMCKQASEGTTNRVRLQEERFLALAIPLPPLAEQRRIVARIEALAAQIEEARDLRRQAVEETDVLVQTMARRVLSGVNAPVTQLDSWLERNGDGIQTGPFGEQLGSGDFIESGVPVLTIGNVQYSGLRLGNLKYVSEEKARQLDRYAIGAGDILFARMGTVGRCCVVPRECEGWLINYHIIRVALDKSRVEPRYVHWTIRASSEVEAYLDEKIRGATRQGVNSAIVGGIPCRVPPMTEQRRIVAYLDDLQAKVDSLKKTQAETAAELDALLPAILDRAFKGEL